MKTNILITLLISFATAVNGQQNGKIYVYNHGKDTICFSGISQTHYEITNIPVKYDQRADTILINNSTNTWRISASDSLLILDSLQIDGKGSKEIVFCRKISYSNAVHGGTFDGTDSYHLEKIEIWNLDTKEMYWGEVIFYSGSSVGPNNSYSRVIFKYDFKVDSFANIEVDKVRAQIIYDESISFEIIPDLKAGVYKFRNGEYRL
jgi:hypothetical protein